MIGLDGRWSLFNLPTPDAAHFADQTGLLVRTARRADTPEWPNWTHIVRLGMLSRARNGMVAEEFRLYRVTTTGQPAALALMPRPMDEK